MIPARHLPSPEARRRFGDRVDRLGTLFLEGDPLADEAWDALRKMHPSEREMLLSRIHLEPPRDVPQAFRALSEQLSHVPFWVDFERAERGGRALLGRGPLSGHVLALGSLVRSFCSPSGNKPLVATGQLERDTVRRTYQTGRYLQQVCSSGAMQPGAPGFVSTVRVRLLHAQTRARLLAGGRWRTELHGVPISQPDMAGTLLLFSLYLAEGLRRLGSPLSQRDEEDLVHLWRYIGWVMGVKEELLCSSVKEGRDLWALNELTEGLPDDDSRRLARALIENLYGAASNGLPRAGLGSAPWYALSAALIGDDHAQNLGFPRTSWRHVTPAVRTLLRPTSRILWRIPGVQRVSHELGIAYWNWSITVGLSLAAGHPEVVVEERASA
ncbi:MAG: oxygenase MpaB family protein [Myxococcaceae bacterium]